MTDFAADSPAWCRVAAFAPAPPDPRSVPCRAAERFRAALEPLRADLRERLPPTALRKREALTDAFVYHLGLLYNRYRKEAPPGHPNEAGAVDHLDCVAQVLDEALDEYDALATRWLAPRLAVRPDGQATAAADAPPVAVVLGIECELPAPDEDGDDGAPSDGS